ncbi:MAG TPA: ABC transporter permease [Flavitalea sp.]|nr:ABC transporter permease [Flavitalea sp.]
MIRNYFKTMLRNMWKNKTYSFLNIFGLAIGIACTGLIFLWVDDELTFDNVNVKKNRLYRVNVNKEFDGKVFTMGSTPRPLAAALKKEIPGIINASRISDTQQQLLFSFQDKSFYAKGRYADAELFDMFTLPFVKGNPKTAFSELYSIVITEEAAKKFFGDEENVVGKTVRVDNEQDYVVTGVLKNLPENSSLQFEWLAPYKVTTVRNETKSGNSDETNWGSYGPYTYVELEPTASPAAINKTLNYFIHRKKDDQKSQCFLFPMTDQHLYNEFENGKQTGGGQIEQVRMLSIIAWIILFIACINFMNLATANSQKRSREVGVRKVLGAGKQKLIFQFLGEAMFLSMVSTVVAVIIMAIALPAFNVLMQKNLSLDLINPFHIVSLITIMVICGLLAGSYPSLYLSSFKPVLVLKGFNFKAGSALLIRKGLVVLQFTVSVVFIISTIVVYMQIQYVKNRKLGFNKDNLVEIEMQHDGSKIFPIIKQDLLQTGVVQNVALSDHTTIYGGNTDSRFRWQGKPEDAEISIAHRSVTPEFIATSGMKIIDGSDFNQATAETNDVIITRSLAKLMGTESAVGKIIQSPRGNAEGVYTNLNVVGVIDDFVYGNVYGSSGPVMFFCKPVKNASLLYVRLKTSGDLSNAMEKLGAVMKKNNPAYPLQYKFVDEQFDAMFRNETLVSKVSGVFAVLAVIISCLGLFGLAAYTAERRTKEIGIRKVLGASVAGLVSLLSKDFLQLVFISCLVAFPLAGWIMHNWLQNYEFRISMSVWMFLIAGASAIVIALITISFQTIRAAITNPVRSLKTE